MDFFSDTQETASRYGDYIDDLHDVFRCNGIDFGSPEDFFAFARTVKYHSELRGDVLRVVKSVMEGETNVSFRTILTVIAVASGGPDIASSGREIGIPVKQVIETLIGVGACRQLNDDHLGLYSDLTVTESARAVAPDNLSSFSSGGAEAMAQKERAESIPIPALEGFSSSVEEAIADTDAPEHAKLEEEPLLEKAARDTSMDQAQPNDPVGSSSDQVPPNGYAGSGSTTLADSTLADSTLAESLTRLELNSLQLKIYLDSIDQRISRMEPRLENVPSLVLSASPSHPREETGARFSAAIPVATTPARTDPPPAPHNDSLVSKQQDGAATENIAASEVVAAAEPAGGLKNSRRFYGSRRQASLPIVVGVAMLLLAAFLFWRFGRAAVYAVVHSVNASVEGGASAGGPGPAAAAGYAVGTPAADAAGKPQVAAASGRSHALVRGAQGNSSAPAYGYTGHGITRPGDSPVPSSRTTPAQIPLRSPSTLPESPATDVADISPETAADTSEVTAPPVRTYRLSSAPPSNRLVNVSSGVMAANLLSGPKPSYPTLASLTRTQGNVVMQAVISKTGTVEHVHVIKGHRLLRSAAKNAVRTWRYRPYKIGGVPVEVATIVSVDFSLHR